MAAKSAGAAAPAAAGTRRKTLRRRGPSRRVRALGDLRYLPDEQAPAVRQRGSLTGRVWRQLCAQVACDKFGAMAFAGRRANLAPLWKISADQIMDGQRTSAASWTSSPNRTCARAITTTLRARLRLVGRGQGARDPGAALKRRLPPGSGTAI